MGRNRKTGNTHASYHPCSAEFSVTHPFRWRIQTSAAINLFICTMISPGEQFIRFTLMISTYKTSESSDHKLFRIWSLQQAGLGENESKVLTGDCSNALVFPLLILSWSWRRSETNLWTFRSIIKQSRVSCQLVSHQKGETSIQFRIKYFVYEIVVLAPCRKCSHFWLIGKQFHNGSS